MKHARLHGKDFIFLLVMLVSTVLQTVVSVTPNNPMFFKKELNNFIIFKFLPKGQVHTIMWKMITGQPDIARNAPFADTEKSSTEQTAVCPKFVCLNSQTAELCCASPYIQERYWLTAPGEMRTDCLQKRERTCVCVCMCVCV